MLCIQIPENENTVSLLDAETGDVVAGPIPLDWSRFGPGGAVSPDSILAALAVVGPGGFQLAGRALFDAIMIGDIRAKWEAAHAQWREAVDIWDQGQRSSPHPIFRTCFCVKRSALATIPWEILHSPTVPLFQSEWAPCLRSADTLLRPRQDAALLRIRVLLINAADPNDADIRAEEEAAKIQAVLGEHDYAFDLEPIRTADRDSAWTIQKLEQKIRTFHPHVLHFIGHSEAASDRKPAALLLHDGARYWRWETPQIAAFLQDIPSLRLSFLNACRTQVRGLLGGEESAASPYSLAEVFLERSLGVIAMQYDVRGAAASVCAETFYFQLAAGSSVDQAICAARRALSVQFGAATRESYLPALVVRVRPDHVLSLRAGTLNRNDVEENVKPVTRLFVDHRTERRDVHDLLFGIPAAQRNVTVVKGWDGVGKTWLLKWTLYSLGLRGIRVHYIEKPADNWLEVLRQIRDPADCLLSEGCCDAEQKNRFNRALYLLARGQPVNSHDSNIVQDSNRSLAEIMTGDPKPVNDFPERLCTELLSIFDSGPETVCVIDHWEPGNRETEETPQILHRYLLQPLLRRRSSPVRFVLSITGDTAPGDIAGWGVQSVEPFSANEVPDLAEQLLKKIYGDRAQDLHIQLVRRFAQGSMTARQLHDNLEGLRAWIR